MNAYVLLVDNPRLQCPARVSTYLLKELDNSTDVVVLTPPEINLDVPRAKIRKVSYASFKGMGGYKNTFMKFRAAELIEYQKVMYIDLDVVPWTSPRHLFESTHGLVSAPRAYWLPQPFLSSGGPVVFRPIDLLHRVRHVLDGREHGIFPSEMDWFNKEFRKDAHFLDGFYTLLNGEFVPGDSIYGYWGRNKNLSASALLDTATFVHCIAGWKPWLHHHVTGRSLKRVYLKWHRAQSRAC